VAIEVAGDDGDAFGGRTVVDQRAYSVRDLASFRVHTGSGECVMERCVKLIFSGCITPVRVMTELPEKSVHERAAGFFA
jgi:hypothetical protein